MLFEARTRTMTTMKQKLRNQLLQQRKSQSQKQQKQRSEMIVRHLLESEHYKAANNIGLYLAVNSEADPATLRTSSHKQFYLPVLANDEKQGLLFAPIQNNSEYKLNKFAIPEPICPKHEQRKGEQLDLVVMPLVGFDRHGNRLGMGGGFYDRCFAFKNKQPSRKPLLAGFSYAFQELENITAEDWDIKLDFIVTENGIINRQ